MNGLRSTHSRPGDRSSLDALNRTIEGLEARIEGLMQSRDPRRQPSPSWPDTPSEPAARAETPVDPLQAIRDRQRMLAGSRERPLPQTEAVSPPAMPRPRLEPRRPAGEMNASPAARIAAAELHRGPSSQSPKLHADPSLHEIAQALAGLREELKHDIAEGVAREMGNIRPAAREQDLGDDLRADLGRLADGINALGQQGGPAADALRAEYAELHAAIDGLAREESIQRLDNRWKGLEERIVELDTHELREELVGLAYRIDDIKTQLGAMSDSPAIQALEQKLLAVATAMEQLGSRMQPSDASLNDQFALLDDRLDEISRAIAASGRAAAVPATDPAALQRLETRLGALAQQIDSMAGGAKPDTTDILAERMELLAERIEQLSAEQVSLRLEERLDQMSHMLSKASAAHDLPALTEYLADISDKIDRLSIGSINDTLVERLDELARRIDTIDYQAPLQTDADRNAIDRIEDRLSGIAARLDETTRAPSGDSAALRDLEAQIAHLSTLISQPAPAAPLSREVEDRVATLENYMTTNDEYVLEAARQAAEAVVESFARQTGSGSSGVDVTALTALAEDLRHLEELTRNTEERSQHTLNALHSTLVQIADRLDTMEDRFAAPILQSAAPFAALDAAQAAAAVPASVHQELMSSLANGTTHAGMQAAAEPVFGDDDESGDQRRAEEHADDDAIAPEEPVAGTGRMDSDNGKRSLLSQLSQRLRPGQKQGASKPGRTVVDPAPPLDAADMLLPEHENELLEPGSGAPDVRKILERVRASQAADGAQATETDRTDYIAAARRAAKAAALETDPALGASTGRKSRKAASGSALSRHRRPIMMAVGAVLLVLMTMPLIKTLTTGEEAPQPSADSQTPAVEAPGSEATDAAPQSEATIDTSDQVEAVPAAPAIEADPLAAENPDTASAAAGEPDSAAGVSGGSEDIPPAAQAQAEAGTSAEPRIVVPASIGPKSLTDAAEAGDPIALYEIGARYTDGRGVAADLAESANWYKLAADRGLAPAQYRLANLFEKGTGVTRDLGKAVTYYQQAAAAGNASAMHNLAVLHASGANGEPDYAAAVEWFQKAAELGVADSQFNLAILYARGNGTSQDLVESYKWFDIAAKAGDTDASQKRDEVAKAMRKEQLDAGIAMARNWKPKPLDAAANEVSLPDEWANNAKPLTTASVDMEKAILNIQAILNKNGFDAGTPDGKMGQRTIGAIKSFQASIGQEPTGRLNDGLVRELLKRNT